MIKIDNWEELSKVKSDTHVIEIEESGGCGWIWSKADESFMSYLSTHTFYDSQYEESTKVLQSCGFDIELANWDE